MEERVRRKVEEFNKYYNEVMSADKTEEFLKKNLEVMAKVSWSMQEKKIDFKLKVIFIDGDTGDLEVKFDKEILEAGERGQTLEQFIVDYRLCAIKIISMLDIDIKYYPEYVCKVGMTMSGELELEVIYLHNLDAEILKEILNLDAEILKEILNENAKTI